MFRFAVLGTVGNIVINEKLKKMKKFHDRGELD